ncbi:MAG TPA: hypothetical protein DDW98_09235 [Gammaproteobacteria bacterium]|jgi:hypothetical protein|nr:hypothetical protein [Gammaproteobacteria bacterium]
MPNPFAPGLSSPTNQNMSALRGYQADAWRGGLSGDQFAGLQSIYGPGSSVMDIWRGEKDIQNDPQAQVYRNDWLDYVRTFVPIENELIASYRNLGDRREAQGLAVQDVNRGFDQAQAAFKDRLGRYGLAMTPAQQAEQQRRSDFTRGLAEVEGINRTSRRMDDRDMELMTSGVRAPSFTAGG